MTWDEGPRDFSEGEESGGQIPEFLLDPLGSARRRWLPMVLCLAVGLVLTAVAVALWKPIYVATSTILITSQKIPQDFVRSTVQEESLANVNAMLGEVLSAENLSERINQFGLFEKEAEKIARIDLINQMRSRIEAGPQSMPSVSRDTNAIVYGISYQAGNRDEAASVANALAADFVEASVKRRNTQAQRTTEFLRNALERNEKELREHSREVSEFRRVHRGELPEDQETILRKLEMLAAQRESLAQQIAAKEDRIISLSQAGEAASETSVLLTELRRELARQTGIHTDSHPNVIALRERIAQLEASKGSAVPPSTGLAVQDERRERERMIEQRARIEIEVADLNQRVDRIPNIGEQLAALEQKEAVLRDDYVAALRKVEQAELAESLESAQQGGQVSILDPASPPTSPKYPRWLVLVAGLGISLAVALGVGVLLELVDPVMLGARQIERLNAGSVLGAVPHGT